jgi:hypothetical protein
MAKELLMNIQTLLDTPPWEWPRNAGKILREKLADRRAEAGERLAAAEMAGELVVMNDDLADLLLSIAGDSSEQARLRAKAAISLGPALEEADTDQFDGPDESSISPATFQKINESLHQLYLDQTLPKEVRRRILEASVRSPQDWHRDAILAAYASTDVDWVLTAVFAMCYIRGFETQILEALESADPRVHYEAVNAAGNWELDAAWPHVVGLLQDPDTSKPLLLAAINAVGSIRPDEAGPLLVDLTDSEDQEIAEAADEAMLMAEDASGSEDEEGDGEENDAEDEDEQQDWVN